ncbi:hypothetical protein IKA92_00970, partial [bacterium]|nr:hypothetical protein [bacterium]
SDVFTYGSIKIKNSYATGDVSGTSYVGGLIGYQYTDDNTSKFYLDNSFATGNVVASSQYAGGLIGYAQSSDSTTNSITNSYATGDVTASKYAGGLIGYISRYSASSTYNITNTYSSGTVSASSNVGGLIGYIAKTNPTVTNSYYNNDSGITDTSGAIGKYKEWFDIQSNTQGVVGPEVQQITNANKPTDFVAVHTAEELREALTTNKNIVLMNNINMSGISFNAQDYSGTFNGNGFTISNLSQSLITSTNGATIKNVNLENVSINSTASNVGALVGTANNTDIKNITLSGSVKGEANVGALVGYAKTTGENAITNIVSSINVTATGSGNAGGIVGKNEGNVLSDVKSTGTITASGTNIGGIVGDNAGTISSATFAGSISAGNGTNIGGIAGLNNGNIDKAKVEGKITGGSKTGGVVGYNASGIIADSYFAGTLSGGNTTGGIVGENSGTLKNSYASGGITGSSHYLGGIVGINNSGATIENVFTNVTMTNTNSNADYQGAAVGSNSGTITNYAYLTQSTSKFNSGDGIGNSSSTETVNGHNSVWFEDTGNLIDILTFGSSSWTTQELNSITLATNTEIDTGGVVTVKTVDELKQALSTNRSIILGADINLSGVTWTPIQNYTGVFNGNGYTISNLSGSQGLFASTDGATIENLYLTNVDITGSSDNVGALIGSANNTTIREVTVSGTVENSGSHTGGLVGKIDATISSFVVNVTSNVNVTGSNHVGGVAGSTSSGTTISFAENNGTISGDSGVGGITGANLGIIANSTNNGTLSATTSTAGGIAAGNNGSILFSTNTGTINATNAKSIGGIVGVNRGTVNASSNSGNITGKNYIGGIAGEIQGGKVTNTYNTGEITGGMYVGGLAGAVAGELSFSYNSGEISVTGNYAGGVAGTLSGSGSITNVYSIGTITKTGSSQSYIGSVVGAGSGTLENYAYVAQAGISGNSAYAKSADWFTIENISTILAVGDSAGVWNIHDISDISLIKADTTIGASGITAGGTGTSGTIGATGTIGAEQPKATEHVMTQA